MSYEEVIDAVLQSRVAVVPVSDSRFAWGEGDHAGQSYCNISQRARLRGAARNVRARVLAQQKHDPPPGVDELADLIAVEQSIDRAIARGMWSVLRDALPYIEEAAAHNTEGEGGDQRLADVLVKLRVAYHYAEAVLGPWREEAPHAT